MAVRLGERTSVTWPNGRLRHMQDGIRRRRQGAGAGGALARRRCGDISHANTARRYFCSGKTAPQGFSQPSDEHAGMNSISI